MNVQINGNTYTQTLQSKMYIENGAWSKHQKSHMEFFNRKARCASYINVEPYTKWEIHTRCVERTYQVAVPLSTDSFWSDSGLHWPMPLYNATHTERT